MKYIFLYNPLAGEGKASACAEALSMQSDSQTVFMDLTKIDDFGSFIGNLSPEDTLIVCGGDGTLNRFANAVDGLEISNTLLYYPAGSGNDFMHDLGRKEADGAFDVKGYITALPSVTVKGKKYRFINGVGYGIDGVVCEEGNRLRGKGKKVDYTALAVKCLMFLFNPVNATVIIDGETFNYRKVWMTTTMKGRFFGGGMRVTPHQDRSSEDGKISVLVAHNLGKLKIVTLFPSIFKGNHIKYTDHITIHKCHSMSVKYDRPCALQMDGETISDVTEYSAEAGCPCRQSELNPCATKADTTRQ